MKTKFGIVGCGFLGGIVASAWKNGLLPDYELVGVTSRTRASAEKLAAEVGCPVCDDVDALLTLQPEYIVETASVEAVRAMAVPVLKKGVNLVIISIGAFADLDFYEQVKAAAVEGGAKVHLASGAIGGFGAGYWLLGFIAGLGVRATVVSVGIVLILLKQRKGLHSKKVAPGVYVYAHSRKI